MSGWYRFNFFEIQPVQDHLRVSLNGATVIDVTTSPSYLFVVDSSNYLHIVSLTSVVYKYQFKELKVKFIRVFSSQNTIFAFGNSDCDAEAVRVYAWCADTNSVIYTQNIRFPHWSAESAAIACVGTHEAGGGRQVIACGSSHGVVAYWKGDIVREKNLKYTSINVAKTSVICVLPYTGPDCDILYLFVCTQTDIFSYTIKQKEHNKIHLDTHGGSSGNCVIMSSLSESQASFVVAKDDLVIFYSPTVRGSYFVFEGSDYLLCNHKKSLATLALSKKKQKTVTVYDCDNHVVIMSSPLQTDCTHMVSLQRSLVLLTSDGRIECFKEMSLKQKLRLLLNKNVVHLAVRIMESNLSEISRQEAADVYRKFGDQLYTNCDYNLAVKEYIKTIGYLEPSYVIRKFMEGQRVEQMTQYLEALHDSDLNKPDYTKLLVNCYSKQQNAQKLDRLLQSKSLDYDVDSIIEMCLSSGFYETACRFAVCNELHDKVIVIYMDYIDDLNAALDYLRTISRIDCKSLIMKHGIRLIQYNPEDTVLLIIRICDNEDSSHLIELIEVFDRMLCNLLRWRLLFLTSLYKSHSELFNRDFSYTLLEVYLNCNPSHRTDASHQCIIQLIESNILDNRKATELCVLHKFREGILRLNQIASKYDELLDFHLNSGAIEQALDVYRQYTTCNSHYMLLNILKRVLDTYTRDDVTCNQHLLCVLSEIEACASISFNDVISLFSGCDQLPLEQVREFLIRGLRTDGQLIVQNEAESARLRAQLAATGEHIKLHESSSMQFRSTVCSSCSAELDLPAVHYFCSHSFHQRCLRNFSEHVTGCPVCAPDNAKFLTDTFSQMRTRDDDKLFVQLLHKCDNAMGLVAEYIGKGMLDNQFSKNRISQTLSFSDADNQLSDSKVTEQYEANTPVSAYTQPSETGPHKHESIGNPFEVIDDDDLGKSSKPTTNKATSADRQHVDAQEQHLGNPFETHDVEGDEDDAFNPFL